MALPAYRLVNLAYMLAMDGAKTEEARKRLEREFDPRRRRGHRVITEEGDEAPWWWDEGDEEIDVTDLGAWGVAPGDLGSLDDDASEPLVNLRD